MFALGLLSWMYHRPAREHRAVPAGEVRPPPRPRRGQHPRVQARATPTARPPRRSPSPTRWRRPSCDVGTYRQITGNTALAYGIVTAGQLSGLPVFLGSYPITPASDILHELSKHKSFGVTTFQAEDEIAGVGAALGAAFGGALGRHHHLGAGHLAQVRDDRPRGRAGAAAAGRRRAARRPVHGPAHQDRAGRPAAGHVRPQRRGAAADHRAALARRLLRRRAGGRAARGHLPHAGDPAVGRRRWPTGRSRGRCRTPTTLPTIDPGFATEPNAPDGSGEFWPYLRDDDTLARPWAVPGTPGLEHRIGGLEKADGRGYISYDPDNHDRMVRLRAAKIDGIPVPDLEVDDPDGDAELLVLGWGSTYGPIGAGARRVRAMGRTVAQAHLRHLNPLPANLGEVLAPLPHRAGARDEPRAARDAAARRATSSTSKSYTKVSGLPFKAEELQDLFLDYLNGVHGMTAIDLGLAARLGWGSTGSRPPTRSRPPRTSRPTRRCAGARAAATTPCSPPCASSCPTLGIRRENTVFVSGIGCSSRFPYYLNTYGMHSIHGRAPAIATGLAVTRARPVGVGRHRRRRRALHRRQPPDPRAAPQRQPQDPAVQQPDLRADEGPVLADREEGKVTKSTPMGSVDHPFNPISLALGAEATFVGARPRLRPQGPHAVLGAAAAHRGTALVEIFQDCPIFNDGSFDVLRKGEDAAERLIPVTPRRADPLRPRGRGRAGRLRRGARGLRAERREDRRGRRRRRSSCTTRPTSTWRSRCPGCPTRTSTTPSPASSATSTASRTTTPPAPRSTQAKETGAADLQALLNGRDTWTDRRLSPPAPARQLGRSGPSAGGSAAGGAGGGWGGSVCTPSRSRAPAAVVPTAGAGRPRVSVG